MHVSETKKRGIAGEEKNCEESPGIKLKPLLLPRTGDRLRVGLSSYGLNRMAVRTYEDTEMVISFTLLSESLG